MLSRYALFDPWAFAPGAIAVVNASAGGAWALPASAAPQYRAAAPITPSGWALLGELDKIVVGGSAQRWAAVTDATPAGGALRLALLGAAGEAVTMTLARVADGRVQTPLLVVECEVPASGTFAIECDDGACACASA